MLDKSAFQDKVQYCPKAYAVNLAVTWEESIRTYLGRSHGRNFGKEKKMRSKKVCREKSADAIVVSI